MGKKARKRAEALAASTALVPAAVQGARSLAERRRRDLEAGFRPLGGSLRDLPAITHERMIEVALHLWDRNPMGRRIIMAQAEWMIGDGVSFRAADPRTDELLRRYWALNRLDLGLMPMVCELGLFGEDFATAHARRFTGIIYQGTLDPGWVREVVPSCDNAAVSIGVIQKASAVQGELRWRTVLRREDEEALSPAALRERELFADGEVMHAAVNKLRLRTRGMSDLFALADWLGGYEELLFAELQRARALSFFFWDYEWTGLSQDEIDERMAELAAPRPFSNFGHNEKVKRKLVGPETHTAENDATGARLFRNHVLGGAGLPEHWYGGGGDVNRSTSDSMDATAVKTLTARQTGLKHLIRDRLLVQVEFGIRSGYLRDTPEVRDVEVDMPDLSTLDLSRVAGGFSSILGGLAIGKREGWVANEVAARFVAALGKHLQVDIDPEEMLALAQAERKSGLADDAAAGFDLGLQRRLAEAGRRAAAAA